MRKARLLSTVAATLLFAAGAASAQTMKNDEAPTRTPAAQQKAPAEKIAPALKAGERKAPETTGQAAPNAAERDKSKMKSQTMDKDAKPNANKGASDTKGNVNIEPKGKTGAAEGAAGSKASESTKSETKSSTTGQGSAAGAAKLSTEQRSKITTIIRQKKVQPVHLTVSVRVGTRITENVHYYPLPAEVFVIYPEWRGYDYILVGDEIIVVDPRTHEIVAILDA